MGQIIDCKCLKCGYSWAKKNNSPERPAVCPICNNKKWWLPRSRASPLSDIKIEAVKETKEDIKRPDFI